VPELPFQDHDVWVQTGRGFAVQRSTPPEAAQTGRDRLPPAREPECTWPSRPLL